MRTRDSASINEMGQAAVGRDPVTVFSVRVPRLCKRCTSELLSTYSAESLDFSLPKIPRPCIGQFSIGPLIPEDEVTKQSRNFEQGTPTDDA